MRGSCFALRASIVFAQDGSKVDFAHQNLPLFPDFLLQRNQPNGFRDRASGQVLKAK